MPRSSLSLSAALLIGACASPPLAPPPTQAAEAPSQAASPTTGTALRLPDGRLVATLVARPWDPADAAATCKVYHHVYSPDGRQLTKGKGGSFEHHRGLFVGWNRTRWRGQQFDFWHMNRGETQRLREFLPAASLSLPAGAQVAAIDWCAPDGTVVVEERRGLAVVTADDNHLVLHLRIELRAAGDDVQLDGDPQHAGQQFRALQLFSEPDGPRVRYLRPTGAAAQPNDVWTDCAWIAALLPLPDGPVTVLRVESAANAGRGADEATWSTRDYGRFGATRTVVVTAAQPLQLDQYYVVATGERDASWCFVQGAYWRLRPVD